MSGARDTNREKTMDQAIQARLDELRAEFRDGQQQLAELEAREAALRETLLRISGAIQVLEEMTGEQEAPAEVAANGSEPAAV